MRIVELVLAVAFALGGMRSLWAWVRRPFDGVDVTDHVLYALFLTGRVGLWFAFAGLFFIYATLPEQGRAALDALEEYRWYLLLLGGLGVVQLGAAWFLGRRGDAEGAARSGPGRD